MPTALLNAPTRITVSKHPLSVSPLLSSTHRLNTPSLSTSTSIPFPQLTSCFVSLWHERRAARPTGPAPRNVPRLTTRSFASVQPSSPTAIVRTGSVPCCLLARDLWIFTCDDVRGGELARSDDQGPLSDLTSSRRERASGNRTVAHHAALPCSAQKQHASSSPSKMQSRRGALHSNP